LLTASAAVVMGKKWFLKTYSNSSYNAMGKVQVADFSLNRLSDYFVALSLLKNDSTQRILSWSHTN